MKIEISKELVQAMKDNVQVIHDAIEAEENPGEQIAYRKMAGIGNFDPHPGGAFQVITEICVDERFFIPDGDIVIITNSVYARQPYKEKSALDVLREKDMIMAGLEEGSDNWKAEYDNCRQILTELVACKLIKDNKGKTENYIKRKAAVWERATQFLQSYQRQS